MNARDTQALISVATNAAVALWAEWPTLAAAQQPAPSRWCGAPPDADVDYVEHEILGRPMTDEEAHDFAVAFAGEWARLADLAEEREAEGRIDPVERWGE